MDSDSSGDEMMHSRVSSSGPSPKRARFETDEEDVSSSVSSSSDSDGDEQPATLDVATRDMSRVPTRRPVRRPRYATGNARADDFVATVRLMSEVEALRRQRDELMSLHYARVLNSGSRDQYINTTIEYYDTFRAGFRGHHIPEIYRFFDNRLDRAIFAYGGSGLGLDTWIEQWRRYTHIFPSISMRLRSLNVIELTDPSQQPSDDPTIATCMIDTQGVLDGLISRQAVCTVFPHLRHREDLIHKLVGRSLNLPMNLRFYFNSRGHMIRYDFDGDYFQALSNVEDVGLIELTEIMAHVAIGDNTTVPAPVEIVEEE